MQKMTKNGKEYLIDLTRVEKLLTRGFSLVTTSPDPEDVKSDQDDLQQLGEI
jgi:hypothetical protein